jgi:hypothetical protein
MKRSLGLLMTDSSGKGIDERRCARREGRDDEQGEPDDAEPSQEEMHQK